MSNPAGKPTVMVVDDSRTILESAKLFLGDNYNVVLVKNGFSALAALEDHRPDVLFLDVVMPQLDGFNTCLAIKDNPDFQQLPIIILSSKDSPFDKAHGRLMGCDDYLTKPFTQQGLLASVRKHLQRSS